MTLDNRQIESILKRDYILDCPILELIPHSSSPYTHVHKGSGYLSVGETDSIYIKVYPHDQVPIPELINFLNEKLNWRSGEIIDKKYFYRLYAIDLNGMTWEAEGVLPEVIPSPAGALITGKVRRLTHRETLKQKFEVNRIKIFYSTLINFPRNTWVETETKVGGASTNTQHSLSNARFSSCEIQFSIENKEDIGCTVLSAESYSRSFNNTIISRIIDAFSFVTGSIHPWSIIEIFHQSEIVTTIQANRIDLNPTLFGPPITIGFRNEAVWNLFDKYLSYVIRSAIPIGDSLGNIVRSIIESGHSTINVTALTLSVSIEALIREHFKEHFPKDESLSKNIEKARFLIEGATDLDSKFQARVLGAFGSWNNPRSKDFLYWLEEKGIVNETQIKNYENLRNPSAHGEFIDPEKIQFHLNKCGSALVLFYQLIFLRIGYIGTFTDYGEYKYPDKEFSGTLPFDLVSGDDAVKKES